MSRVSFVMFESSPINAHHTRLVFIQGAWTDLLWRCSSKRIRVPGSVFFSALDRSFWSSNDVILPIANCRRIGVFTAGILVSMLNTGFLLSRHYDVITLTSCLSFAYRIASCVSYSNVSRIYQMTSCHSTYNESQSAKPIAVRRYIAACTNYRTNLRIDLPALNQMNALKIAFPYQIFDNYIRVIWKLYSCIKVLANTPTMFRRRCSDWDIHNNYLHCGIYASAE